MAVVGVVALAGCAAPPGRSGSASNGRVYDAKLGVFASPRLIGDGEQVPRGGGTYLVGRPYTIGGRAYYPSERPDGYTAVGTASWYGDAFHGRRTANGEIFDKNSISAAHPTLPLPSYVRVTNTLNGRSMIVRVNDRGPYHGGRVMDVSQRVAEALNFKSAGTARIKIEYVGRAGLKGSDDEKLLATLRIDGGPASLGGGSDGPTMLANDEEPPAHPPAAPRRDAIAEVERTPRPEGDSAGDAMTDMPPSPPRRRYAAPVPPQRPYDFGASEDAIRAPTAPAYRPFVARAAPRQNPPALVSFAPMDPEPSVPRAALPRRTSPAWQDVQTAD